MKGSGRENSKVVFTLPRDETPSSGEQWRLGRPDGNSLPGAEGNPDMIVDGQSLAVLLAVISAAAYLATRLSAVLLRTRRHGCGASCQGCSLAAKVLVRPPARTVAKTTTESDDPHPSSGA